MSAMVTELDLASISSSDILQRTRKPHPLLISGVVGQILKRSSYSDLKTLRQVCSTWQNEASKLLNKKTEIRFVSEAQVEKYLKEFEENSCCNSFEFGPPIALKSPAAYEFLSAFGYHVESLKIHSVHWSCSELWILLSEVLPNLKELSIRIFIPKYGHFFPDANSPTKFFRSLRVLKLNFALDQPDEYFMNSTFLREFLISIPNLERLCCPSWPTIILPSTNVSSLVLNVIFLDQNIRFPNLKYLCINANLDNIQVQELMQKKFPLEELRLELKPDVTSDSLFWLLKTLEVTLKTLTLTFPFGYDSSAFLEFPILMNLQHLCLNCYEGSVSEFKQFFPKLKTLLLNDVNLTDNPYKDDNILCEPLEDEGHPLSELYVEGRMYGAVGQTKKLVQLFPNLRKLKLQNANDEMLRVIFVGFPKLDNLILMGGKFTDSGVTGIPFEACPEIYSFENSFLKLHGHKLRMYPFIGCLKKLENVELTSNFLTPMSMILGVNQCPNLKIQRILSSEVSGVIGR